MVKDKIIIAAGGTGGHLYPGIALARELRKRGFDPVFVVREGDLGLSTLRNEKFSFHEIPIAGLPRPISFKLIKFVILLIKGIVSVFKFLGDAKPKAVIGMGGYISFPAVFVAYLRGIKTIIHEQNYIPGLSNRLLFSFVNKVAVSFEDSLGNFPKEKTFVTGNPVRMEIFEADKSVSLLKFGLSKKKFTVLVFGGSQGASAINRIAIGSLHYIQEIGDKIQFIHISGQNDFSAVEKGYNENIISGVVFPYIETIGEAYSVADLIICRSGATTIAELKILNKPSILIPYPYATGNHQEFNAHTLVNSGIASMIIEKELSGEILAKIIVNNFKEYSGCLAERKMPLHLPQEQLADLILNLD